MMEGGDDGEGRWRKGRELRGRAAPPLPFHTHSTPSHLYRGWARGGQRGVARRARARVQVDEWGVGCVALEMLVGTSPFQACVRARGG